ncbi:conserved hypothetical protein [Theileria equi strain WA]|uniref:Exportin-1/Importin-beta-like domain-containing protein n=1 Tax=Theileria equi strain WA TaxID=1537102 RepID=L1LBR0_THEEQ|nr:conserved hypothetical protein [Theileria equi strain WA]EKX72872.1 conserved hypothetical protein [Theileria equi strain WA]|eukprot:XP_004832324.1 conserved hypothetical protein [Theileria equi strain WA]
MITADILNAVFAAQDGNLNATQMLHGLVETEEGCKEHELSQKLSLSYELLHSLVSLSDTTTNELIVQFITNSGVSATKEKYTECVNILRFYGYTLLVKFVENNWHLIPDNFKLRCKMDVERLFSNNQLEPTVVSEYTSLVNQKAAQYVSTIAVREWPSEWREFILLCINSINSLFVKYGAESKNNKQVLNEILIFGGIVSEISVEIKDCMDLTILHKRRIQISNMLKSHICDIFVTIHRIIILGIVSTNDNLMSMIITIFHNISCILDGFIFIEFDVDEFLVNNIGGANHSDIMQTISNICVDIAHKKLKNVVMPQEFDISDEKLYVPKLDRFIQNLVRIGECMSIDCDFDTTLQQLQIAQALKALFDKNILYLLEKVSCESMGKLFDFLMTRLIMHPSMEVSTTAVHACSLILRRVTSAKFKRREDLKLTWLDYKKLLLCLFVKSLKLGNVPLQEKFLETKPFTCLDGIIANITNGTIVNSGSWIDLLFRYYIIDDELCIGQMKNFEARFAALRSSILQTTSLVSVISSGFMSVVIKTISEVFISISSRFSSIESCNGGICTIYQSHEKQLHWLCEQYVLYDGILFLFESAIFRLRSATIDATGNADAKNPDWMQVSNYASGIPVEILSKDMILPNEFWINNALGFTLQALGMRLPNAHGSLLEIRRLDMISTSSILLLYNAEPIKNVLEFVVSLILQDMSSSNVTMTHKCALQTLVSLCKNCCNIMPPYVEPIVSRIRECLLVVTSDSAKDLLLESLVSLISCFRNFETQRRLSLDVISPYLEEIYTVSKFVTDISPEAESLKIFQYLFGNVFNEVSSSDKRKSLHRVITMAYSIIKRSFIPVKTLDGSSGKFRHPLQDSFPQLLPAVLKILTSLIGMWSPSFFARDEWRKAVLSPGEDEWLSLQGFNEAIATDSNLGTIVESVFHIPKDTDAESVRSCRRYTYIIRQAALRLCGEVLSHLCSSQGRQVDDMIERTLIEPLKWSTLSHISQIIRFALIPAGLSIRNMIPQLLNLISERINGEWKALNRLRNLVIKSDAASEGSESRILHLYYLRVYACIEAGLQLLSLTVSILQPKKNKALTRNIDLLTGNDSIASSVFVHLDSIGSNDSSGNFQSDNLEIEMFDVSSENILNRSDFVHSMLSCLSCAVCWPHCRTIVESLRIMRIYSKLVPKLDQKTIKLAIGFISELLVFLISQLTIQRTFDPMNLGSNSGIASSYQIFWSNTKSGGNNYIKEFVNTMCSLYEALVKCFPQMTETLTEDGIDVQKLLQFQQVVESIRLLTPFLQEQDCLVFLRSVITQNSTESRTLLKRALEETLQNSGSLAKKLLQLSSSLETKSAKEIEIIDGEDSEDCIFGSDILYLLLE